MYFKKRTFILKKEWVECLSMNRETGSQFQVESYQRHKSGIWCLLNKHLEL